MRRKWLSLSIGLIILLVFCLYLGSVPPSPFYYLKIARETIQSKFIFGMEDRSNWLLTLAEKRLTEAERLDQKGLGLFARMQLQSAKEYQQEALSLLQILSDKTNITYLIDKANQNKEKLNRLEAIE